MMTQNWPLFMFSGACAHPLRIPAVVGCCWARCIGDAGARRAIEKILTLFYRWCTAAAASPAAAAECGWRPVWPTGPLCASVATGSGRWAPPRWHICCKQNGAVSDSAKYMEKGRSENPQPRPSPAGKTIANAALCASARGTKALAKESFAPHHSIYKCTPCVTSPEWVSPALWPRVINQQEKETAGSKLVFAREKRNLTRRPVIFVNRQWSHWCFVDSRSLKLLKVIWTMTNGPVNDSS